MADLAATVLARTGAVLVEASVVEVQSAVQQVLVLAQRLVQRTGDGKEFAAMEEATLSVEPAKSEGVPGLTLPSVGEERS